MFQKLDSSLGARLDMRLAEEFGKRDAANIATAKKVDLHTTAVTELKKDQIIMTGPKIPKHVRQQLDDLINNKYDEVFLRDGLPSNKNRDLRQCVIDTLNSKLSLSLNRYDIRKCKRFGPQTKKPRTVIVQTWDKDIKHAVLSRKKALIGSILKVRDFFQDQNLELLQEAYQLKTLNLVFGVWATRQGVFVRVREHDDPIKIRDKDHIAKLLSEFQKRQPDALTTTSGALPLTHTAASTSMGYLNQEPPVMSETQQNIAPLLGEALSELNPQSNSKMFSLPLLTGENTTSIPGLQGKPTALGQHGYSARLDLDPSIQAYLAFHDKLKKSQS